MRNPLAWLVLACTLALLGGATPATVPDVDLALVLLVDTSGSVNEEDYHLQLDGIAAALYSPEITQAIVDGALGRIAVAMVEFSSAAEVRIGWTILDSRVSALAFGDRVGSLTRDEGDLHSMTSISAGLALAISLVEAAPVRATRRVIDVSGDGPNNQDAIDLNMEMVRERATVAKIVINGLAITDEDPATEQFYRDWVLLGRGAFLIPAENSLSFARAMRRKLVREIS